jgi:uncharacterized membrane protein
MTPQKPRYLYIDLLRGWAVLVMIEVHVVNTFLLPEVRLESWFPYLNFLNGLVAPTFLFISGYAFVLVAQRKWNDYLACNTVFFKQVGRILQVWAVGYALHLPVFSYRRLMVESQEMWMPFWKVDVLHCIAFSLLLMLVLVVIVRRQKYFIWAVGAVGLLAIYAAPYTWSTNLDALVPLPIANYFNMLHGSLFPLIPWLGFVFCGGMVSYAVVHLRLKMEPERIFKGIFAGGAVLMLVSLLLAVMPFDVFPPHHFGRYSPLFVFVRIGIVLMMLSALYFWEQKYKSKASIVSVAGAESLVSYSFHLLVIYGLFFDNKSLSFIIGKTLTLSEVTGMTIVLVAVTVLIAYVWNWIKKRNMSYARIIQYSLLATVLYIFLTKTN